MGAGNTVRFSRPRWQGALVLAVLVGLAAGCQRPFHDREQNTMFPEGIESSGLPDQHAPGAIRGDQTPTDPPSEDTTELLVRLEPGTEPCGVGERYGLVLIQTLRSDPDMHVFDAGSIEAVHAARARLAADPEVRAVYLNVRTTREPRRIKPSL
jgi:hypothetical protein